MVSVVSTGNCQLNEKGGRVWRMLAPMISITDSSAKRFQVMETSQLP